MASDPVIDIEQLCSPVRDGQPSGPYWREDEKCSSKLYPRVDTAIRAARSDDRRKAEVAYFPEDAIERRNYEEPDWHEVTVAAQSLLAESKDLWVAAWLTESLAREHGFAGLRDGFCLIRQLCEKYWDSVHPRPDDIDGIRNTIAQLDGDLLAELVLLMPITQHGLTIADYDMSAEMDGLESESERQQFRNLGVIGTAEFEARVRESGAEFLQNLIQDAEAANKEFEALVQLLDELCGDQAPASSKVQENFRQSIDLIRELAGPHLPQRDEVELPENGDGPSPDGPPVDKGSDKQVAWNRDQAFNEISRQAELFAKYEPNSPVASILRQAVRVGRLSWQEMISGFLSKEDDNALKQILKQTGVTGNSGNDAEN